MKVNGAAKALVTPIVAAIESICNCISVLPKHIIHTAEFTADIDSLFNPFNSSSIFRNSKPLREPLSIKSKHISFGHKCFLK